MVSTVLAANVGAFGIDIDATTLNTAAVLVNTIIIVLFASHEDNYRNR